jgi:hypothetical protein
MYYNIDYSLFRVNNEKCEAVAKLFKFFAETYLVIGLQSVFPDMV